MGLFDFLPLGGSSTPLQTIPTFKQGAERDPTDLQVRSLLYLFKRLRINKLASFSAGNTLKYADGKSWDGDGNSQESSILKLDKTFNLRQFQILLLQDEQRVLVDWPKNKFRSLCFLSEPPTSNPAVPQTLNTNDSVKTPDPSLPVFDDYKGRAVHGFAFTIIPVNTNIFTRDLALDLAQSQLYVEHHSYISFTSRVQTAERAIAKFSEKGNSMLYLTEELKSLIIEEYLRRLAFLVQLVRIYQSFSKAKDAESTTVSPKKATASSSDIPRTLRFAKSFSRLPRPSLSPSKSSNSSGSFSPVRNTGENSPTRSDSSPRKHLSASPSISKFRANEIYNPVTSPPKSATLSDPKGISAKALSSHLSEVGKENPEMWERCKVSIREKLAREKAVLMMDKVV